MRTMEREGGALSCAASSWGHFNPLHKWNLSPSPPTPQYYSIHVYKPCPSFWWHSYWHLVLGWHWDWRGDVFGYIGQFPHLYFYSSVSFILPLLFSVRHTHTQHFMKIEAWKTTCNSSHKYCGIKYIFSLPRSTLVIFHRVYLLSCHEFLPLPPVIQSPCHFSCVICVLWTVDHHSFFFFFLCGGWRMILSISPPSRLSLFSLITSNTSCCFFLQDVV